jgi:hypothetical protein
VVGFEVEHKVGGAHHLHRLGVEGQAEQVQLQGKQSEGSGGESESEHKHEKPESTERLLPEKQEERMGK